MHESELASTGFEAFGSLPLLLSLCSNDLILWRALQWAALFFFAKAEKFAENEAHWQAPVRIQAFSATAPHYTNYECTATKAVFVKMIWSPV
jgi:hypothetical protein